MSLITLRKRPVSTPAASADADATTRTAWGLSPAQWDGLTDSQRAWHRWNLTKAPNFSAQA